MFVRVLVFPPHQAVTVAMTSEKKTGKGVEFSNFYTSKVLCFLEALVCFAFAFAFAFASAIPCRCWGF